MAYIQSGNATDSSLATVDPTAKSIRSSMRPLDSVTSVKTTSYSGVIAASTAAASVLYTYRNVSSYQHVLRRISIGFNATTGYTQGSVVFGAYASRVFYTQGTTNATQSIGNLSIKRSNLPTPTSQIYVATTTGITGDVNYNLDVVPFAMTGYDISTGVTFFPRHGDVLSLPVKASSGAYPALVDLYNGYDINTYPQVIAPNEGFQLQNISAFPATGSGTLIINIEYEEVLSF